MIKIGSHVKMGGKDMLLGSAKEAVSYGANTFMVYTGAPQNTKRKAISELNIDTAWEYMKQNGIEDFVIHAPYIINLGNSVNPETIPLLWISWLWSWNAPLPWAAGFSSFIRAHMSRRCRNRAAPDHPGTECGIDSGHSLLYSTGDHGRQGFGNRPQL